MIVISSLLLILAIHFLLQGINYRKNIYLEHFEYPDTCKQSSILPSNIYIDDKNDANFKSEVLDTNKFYFKPETKQTPENPENPESNPESSTEWKYKNELVMNGGELLTGITGYEIDDFYNYTENSTTLDVNDLRMGKS